MRRPAPSAKGEAGALEPARPAPRPRGGAAASGRLRRRSRANWARAMTWKGSAQIAAWGARAPDHRQIGAPQVGRDRSSIRAARSGPSSSKKRRGPPPLAGAGPDHPALSRGSRPPSGSRGGRRARRPHRRRSGARPSRPSVAPDCALGHDPAGDPTDRLPVDAHQWRDGALGRALGEPGAGVLEGGCGASRAGRRRSAWVRTPQARTAQPRAPAARSRTRPGQSRWRFRRSGDRGPRRTIWPHPEQRRARWRGQRDLHLQDGRRPARRPITRRALQGPGGD